MGDGDRRPKKGESAPAAPIAWNGLVFIGNAGGDIKGVKGRMYALDAETGKIVWEFYLVPKRLAIRPAVRRAPRRSISPPGDAAGSPITGGATWTSYTLGPGHRAAVCTRRQSGAGFCHRAARRRQSLLRFSRRSRRQNRAYKTHFKIVPNDWHDWDVSSAPALIQTAGGKKLMFVAPKDGHLYGFRPATPTPCCIESR